MNPPFSLIHHEAAAALVHVHGMSEGDVADILQRRSPLSPPSPFAHAPPQETPTVIRRASRESAEIGWIPGYSSPPARTVALKFEKPLVD